MTERPTTLRSVPWDPVDTTTHYDGSATGVRTKHITPNGTSRCPYERKASAEIRLADIRAEFVRTVTALEKTIAECDREIDERPTLQAPPP